MPEWVRVAGEMIGGGLLIALISILYEVHRKPSTNELLTKILKELEAIRKELRN